MEQKEKNEEQQSQDHGRREDDPILTVDDILEFYAARGKQFFCKKEVIRMLNEYLIDPIDEEFELLNENLPYE